MITGTNNPFPCSPVVFSAGNSIISLGTITRVGNVFTFSVGFVWKINGVTYQNNAPVVLTVSEASEGFQRIDNALLNTSNTIELQQGLESDTIALQPTFPENTVLLTSWNISGDIVGDQEASIVGNLFQQKDFDNVQLYTGVTPGTNIVIPLNKKGRRVILLQGNIVNVKGLSMDVINADTTSEIPHEGKIITIINDTENPIILNHFDAAQDFFFVFKALANLVIPSKERIDFMIRSSALEEHYKSWQDLKTINGQSIKGTGDLVISSGGSNSQFVRLFTPLYDEYVASINTWRSWAKNSSNILNGNANVSLGNGAIPNSSLVDCNFFVVNGASTLSELIFVADNGFSSKTYEIFVQSFTFAHGTDVASETNKQTLVQQVVTTSSANKYTRVPLNIATNTLGAVTGIKIAWRHTGGGGAYILQAIQMLFKFD